MGTAKDLPVDERQVYFYPFLDMKNPFSIRKVTHGFSKYQATQPFEPTYDPAKDWIKFTIELLHYTKRFEDISTDQIAQLLIENISDDFQRQEILRVPSSMAFSAYQMNFYDIPQKARDCVRTMNSYQTMSDSKATKIFIAYWVAMDTSPSKSLLRSLYILTPGQLTTFMRENLEYFSKLHTARVNFSDDRPRDIEFLKRAALDMSMRESHYHDTYLEY